MLLYFAYKMKVQLKCIVHQLDYSMEFDKM